jgi:periplasmic protein TonB
VYALEPEPEQSGRWRRLATGAAVAAVLVLGLGYGAQRFEPTRKLIQRVVQMTVLPEQPKKQPDLPPRTEPPPPPPKRPPPKNAAKPIPQQAPQTPKPQAESQDQVVGLDDGSFGESGSGPGFQVGNTQLGDPTPIAQPPPAPPAPVVQGPPPKVIEARVVSQPKALEYTADAKKLGIEGLIIVELDIDENGKVTRVRLRKSLHESLDRAVLDAIRSWTFAPATLAGKAIPSTLFRRARFELER